jgi:hypothetical protein
MAGDEYSTSQILILCIDSSVPSSIAVLRFKFCAKKFLSSQSGKPLWTIRVLASGDVMSKLKMLVDWREAY